MGYCLRFIRNCQETNAKAVGPLSLEEIRQAVVCLVSLAQREIFSEGVEKLQNTGSVWKRSKLLSLAPFLNDNVLRVGGLLQNSDLPFEGKHPALLPQRHHLTYLVFRSLWSAAFTVFGTRKI